MEPTVRGSAAELASACAPALSGCHHDLPHTPVLCVPVCATLAATPEPARVASPTDSAHGDEAVSLWLRAPLPPAAKRALSCPPAESILDDTLLWRRAVSGDASTSRKALFEDEEDEAPAAWHAVRVQSPQFDDEGFLSGGRARARSLTADPREPEDDLRSPMLAVGSSSRALIRRLFRPESPAASPSPRRRGGAGRVMSVSSLAVRPRLSSPCRPPSSMSAYAFAALSVRDPSKPVSGDGEPCQLPVVPGRPEDLNCISAATVSALLCGELVIPYVIIDCRYDYEYDGGHIQGAVHIDAVKTLDTLFFETPLVSSATRPAIIFHCEFSSHRAPEMCRTLRALDRQHSEYPSLIYPELYVLQGGYKAFFQQFQCHCEPQAYVPMLPATSA